MTKLLILAALACPLLAGCLDFPICNAQLTTNCFPGNNDEGPGGECGGLGKFYVWLLDAGCGRAQTYVCAIDAEHAQPLADQMFASVPHGAVSSDPFASAPPENYFCPTGTCVVGSSDGSQSHLLYGWTTDQLNACATYWNGTGDCSWPAADANNSCGGTF